jgi:hypothetical protein
MSWLDIVLIWLFLVLLVLAFVRGASQMSEFDQEEEKP